MGKCLPLLGLLLLLPTCRADSVTIAIDSTYELGYTEVGTPYVEGGTLFTPLIIVQAPDQFDASLNWNPVTDSGPGTLTLVGPLYDKFLYLGVELLPGTDIYQAGWMDDSDNFFTVDFSQIGSFWDVTSSFYCESCYYNVPPGAGPAVPEPATWLLLFLGVAALLGTKPRHFAR